MSRGDSGAPCEKLTRLYNRLPADGACVGYGSDNAGKSLHRKYIYVCNIQ